MTRPPAGLLALALAVAIAAPSAALASSLIFPSTGVRAMGMAGAFIAQGDDASVLDHNPAQLVRLRDYDVEVHYTGFLYHAEYDAAPVPGIGDPLPGENVKMRWRHIPNVFASIPLGDKWNIGGGVFSPIGPAHQYTSEGGQRYQVQQAQVNLAWPTLHVAYRPVSAVAISLGADFGYAWATQKIAVGLVPGFRSLDGWVEVDGTGKPTPRGKLGMLFWLSDEWTIGLVLSHGIDLSVDGTVTANVPQAGINASDPDAVDNVSASQRYPSEGRLGVGYKGERFRGELAMRYYRWSEYTEQRIDLDKEVIGGFEFGDIVIEKAFNDSIAVQGGGGVKLGEKLDHELRAGYVFDQHAAEDKFLAINDLDADRHAIGVGYGFVWNRFSLDFSYNRWFIAERTVTNGQSQAIGVLGDTPVTNNGTYLWEVQTFGGAIGAKF